MARKNNVVYVEYLTPTFKVLIAISFDEELIIAIPNDPDIKGANNKDIVVKN